MNSTPAPENKCCRGCNGRSCGCTLYALAITSGVLAIGFLIGMAICAAKAVEDPRGSRIGQYESLVQEWVPDGIAKFESSFANAQSAGELPVIELWLHQTPGRSEKMVALTDGYLATGKLDDDGDDFPTYDRGYVLSAVFDEVIMPGTPLGHDLEIDVSYEGEKSTYAFTLFDCHVRTERGGEDRPDQYYAEIQYLKTIRLVKDNQMGIVPATKCSVAYNYDTRGSYKHWSDADDQCERIAAGIEGKYEGGLMVNLYSPLDPYMQVGNILGNCSFKFGTAKDTYIGLAVTFAVCCLAFIILLGSCVWCGKKQMALGVEQDAWRRQQMQNMQQGQMVQMGQVMVGGVPQATGYPQPGMNMPAGYMPQPGMQPMGSIPVAMPIAQPSDASAPAAIPISTAPSAIPAGAAPPMAPAANEAPLATTTTTPYTSSFPAQGESTFTSSFPSAGQDSAYTSSFPPADTSYTSTFPAAGGATTTTTSTYTSSFPYTPAPAPVAGSYPAGYTPAAAPLGSGSTSDPTKI